MNEYQRRVFEGRKEFLKLVQKQEKELLKIYEEASRQISYKLSKAKPGGINARYLNELDNSITKYVLELRNNLSRSIKSSIESSSEIASSVQASYFDRIVPREDIKSTFNKMFTQLPSNITKRLISGNYYNDGKTLDKRIWNITNKNAKDIDTLIKANVAKGANARELAKELDKYINPYKKIEAKTLETGMSKNISYQAQRLSRTCLTHANTETYIQGSKMNPFCRGLKWNLSPSHFSRMNGKTDICDTYATQDIYDLGVGIYPPDKLPIGHPNCLCYPTQEVADINKARDELIDWINGGNNPKLDKWLENYGEEFGISKNDYMKSYNAKLENKLSNAIESASKQLNINKFKNEMNQYYKNGNKKVLMLHEKQMDKLRYSEGNASYHLFGGISLERPNKTIDKRNKLGNKYIGTLFHEIGHGEDFKFFADSVGNIDKYMKNNLPMSSSYYYMKDATKKDKKVLTKLLNNEECKDLKRYIMENREMNEALSDICVAITNGKLTGSGGHTAKYFKDKGKVQAETFANLTQIYTKGDKETIELIEKYFPNVNGAYFNLIQDMLKGSFSKLKSKL
ncbi:primosomal protein [Clostridium botulinum]